MISPARVISVVIRATVGVPKSTKFIPKFLLLP